MANRVCEILGIEKPVISAAMTWLTSAEFVAAVSEAGGAGVRGINAGQVTQTADPVERGGFLKGMRLGIKDEGIINSSQAINGITSMKTCAEVVSELSSAF